MKTVKSFIFSVAVLLALANAQLQRRPTYDFSGEDESREDVSRPRPGGVSGGGIGGGQSPGVGGGQTGPIVGGGQPGPVVGGGQTGPVVGGSQPRPGGSGPVSSGLPSSRCPEVCTKILEPLCGSDGVTYNNLCILENASCRSQEVGRPPIRPASAGPCPGHTIRPDPTFSQGGSFQQGK